LFRNPSAKGDWLKIHASNHIRVLKGKPNDVTHFMIVDSFDQCADQYDTIKADFSTVLDNLTLQVN
jgi:hypothetical protein